MDLNLLDEPFAADDVEWRVQQCGITPKGPWAMVLCYVTNRAIMKRLDDVCGKENWRNEYRDIPNNGGVECGISIKSNGEWITKWDAAENTQVEAVKGGRSGAMKRAAVQWGIGRYLYQLEERFAICSTEQNNKWNKASFKDKKTNEFGKIWWQTPELPSWALPQKMPEKEDAQHQSDDNPQPHKQKQQDDRGPDEFLSAFSEFAMNAEITELKKSWAAVDKRLSGTEQHAKAIAVFNSRKSELEGVAA